MRLKDPPTGSSGRPARRWARLRAYFAPRRDWTGPCRCRDPFTEPTAAMAEVLVDARELPLDEQISRTLSACAALPEGRRIRHVNASVPWPLLPMLETRGWTYRLLARENGTAEILIWPRTVCMEALERRAHAARGGRAEPPSVERGPSRMITRRDEP